MISLRVPLRCILWRPLSIAGCVGFTALMLAQLPSHCAPSEPAPAWLVERNTHERHVLDAALSVGSPELCGVAYEPDECRDAYAAEQEARASDVGEPGEDAACEFPAACVEGDDDYQ